MVCLILVDCFALDLRLAMLLLDTFRENSGCFLSFVKYHAESSSELCNLSSFASSANFLMISAFFFVLEYCARMCLRTWLRLSRKTSLVLFFLTIQFRGAVLMLIVSVMAFTIACFG